MLEHLIGPGAVKAGFKIVNSLTGGSCHAAVEALDEMTSCPAYSKYRIDQAQTTMCDFWDDHKESFGEFFDNVGDTLCSGLDAAGEFVENAVDTIAENLGDIVGSFFS